MCEPVTIAVLVVGAVSAGLAYAAKQQAAEANRTSALAAAANSYKQLTQREIQEQDSTAQQTHVQNVKGAVVTANVETAVAANGVSGLSLDSLTRNVQQQVDSNKQIIGQNYDNTIQQLNSQGTGVQAQAEGRIASMPPPSGAGLALQIVGMGLGAAGDYNKANPDDKVLQY